MKLYSYDFAPNPRRVLLHLKHKGIEVETIQVDLLKGEHLVGDFGKINPDMTVPLLVLDDGTALTEVIGILSYLEDTYPENALFGEPGVERAKVMSWCHRLFMQGLTAVAEIFRNGNPAFKDRGMPGPINMPQLPELITRGNLRLDAFFANMDKELQDRDFLVGNKLTQADIDLYVTLGFAGWAGRRQIPDSCPRLQAWFADMKTRYGE
ncbi:glutathione S-transferase family protein [Spongiibacter sp. KMU-158]|uniref:Glutathione S-transferase family protein n=1 Tax=Spongiibacter pelagi TaxID=2760804 RepID=A0A927C286_9GAMM|nr:glutathione S-transferase family protein [Spongiibacter pelagi]MBD2858456.1 glutathione S-transferase family protein [Spongiibacter pelagi]